MPSATSEDLASVPLFASLSESERADVAARFEVRDVGAGERLIGEGATGYLFFVMSEGEVSVTAFGEKVATLGPGEFFGEMALVGDVGHGRHLASVTTTSPSRLLVLFSGDFERLREEYPKIADEIDSTIHRRLRELP